MMRKKNKAAIDQGMKRKPLTAKVLSGLHVMALRSTEGRKIRKNSSINAALTWLRREIEVSGVLDAVLPEPPPAGTAQW